MGKISDNIIRWSFYLLFFLVPLVFFAGSFELFEYNKMMLVYAVTVIVAVAWLSKLISNYGFRLSDFSKSIRRTPLDLPILLYLVSHLISTFISLDSHTSVWGYYSRFHEGLIATISYIFLYYAAVSNLNKKDVFRIIISSFASGVIVSVWGALEHFGHSPSCLMITGKFDDECWVQDVKSRVFATLGQPNWMAAYLDVLILTTLGFILRIGSVVKMPFPPNLKHQINSSGQSEFPITSWTRNSFVFVGLSALYFAALLFTESRSGLLGLIIGAAVLGVAFIFVTFHAPQTNLETIKQWSLQFIRNSRLLLITIAAFIIITLIFGLPFGQLKAFSLTSFLESKPTPKAQQSAPPPSPKAAGAPDAYESGDIRKVVWKGAIKVWERYPIFGSGVETFAFAYYKDRPVEHNLLSEWDFLYNKAHNEFLNVLSTTGTVGMLAYLSLIAVFALWFFRTLRANKSISNNLLLISALFAAYVSVLVTNFFGFSVVIIGLFFFLIPAFSILLAAPDTETVSTSRNPKTQVETIRPAHWLAIGIVSLIGIVMEWNLLQMWLADKSFAYGKNLDSIQQYTSAYQYLQNAVNSITDEPTYRDELSFNESVIALSLFDQATGSAQEKLNQTYAGTNISASTFVQKAISDSNITVAQSPNAVTFWKTRTKVFYNLVTIDKNYLLESLGAIQKAADLAPTDAKIHYNYGLLLGQTGDLNNGIRVLENTIKMKPDYADAYYALGLYYADSGQKAKARSVMEAALKIGPNQKISDWLSQNP